MSILAYTGLPGSGKTYGVVANQVLPALKADRIVVTNIPLYEDRIREIVTTGELREFPIDQVAAQPELIDDYASPGCVLIIDEVWKLFPAGQKVHQVPQPFKSFLAEHRHRVDALGRSTQIVFVTQDLAQIGAFARALVEQTFLHTKLGFLGASGSYRVRIFHGAVTGQNPPKSSELRMMLGRYEERIWRLYKSHTMSAAPKDGADERAVDTRGNIWRRPVIWVGAIGVVAAVAWGLPTAYGVFHHPTQPGTAAAAAASGATGRGAVERAGGWSAPVPAQPVVPAVTPPPRASSRALRVVGYLLNEADPGKSVALVSDGETTVAVPFRRACHKARDGLTVCRVEGYEVTELGATAAVVELPVLEY